VVDVVWKIWPPTLSVMISSPLALVVMLGSSMIDDKDDTELAFCAAERRANTSNTPAIHQSATTLRNEIYVYYSRTRCVGSISIRGDGARARERGAFPPPTRDEQPRASDQANEPEASPTPYDFAIVPFEVPLLTTSSFCAICLLAPHHAHHISSSRSRYRSRSRSLGLAPGRSRVVRTDSRRRCE